LRLRFPWFAVALTIVLAGIIHIASVLSLPVLAPKNAWSRLEAYGPVNGLAVLPAATPETQVMPMMTPDMRVAVCRYDLANGPVKLKADIPDPNWLLAFNSSRGENYYTIQGGDVRQAKVEIIIALIDHVLAEAPDDRPEDAGDILVVRSPTTTGLASISAPLAGPSYAARAVAALGAASCGPYVQ
jgi:uncharacterized membrane protein